MMEISHYIDTLVPKVKKEDIISAITTQRGKYNEVPLVVEDD